MGTNDIRGPCAIVVPVFKASLSKVIPHWPAGSIMRALTFLALAALLSVSAPVLAQDFAQDFARQRELNALKDIAASQRQQTEILRQQAQRDSARAWREENARVNAQRDARSARRFDRH